MPVELTILSGAREGAAIHLDSDAFRIGDDPAAEVAFDPRQDPAGRGRLARVVREESGWRIQNEGGGPLLVNHTVVDGRVPLRSGDIIRLSDMGPDVRFNLVSAARTSAQSGAAEGSPRETREADRAQTGGSVPRHWWAAAAGGLGLLVAVVIGVRILSNTANQPASVLPMTPPTVLPTPPPTAPPAAPAPAAASNTVPHVPVREAKPDSTPVREPEIAKTVPETPEAKLPVTVPPPDPWQSAMAAVVPAVCLLVAETPDKSNRFPFGTACAIRENALLTNAMLAAELQNKRVKGWQVKAVWPSDGQELPVREILIHKAFNATADAPSERIYWELSILRLDGKRQAVVPLAELKELAEIEAGLPLACAGITHRGLPRTRFDHPRVEQFKTEVYLQSRLAAGEGGPSSGAPTLLHLTGTLPKNIYGSPLVNAAGHIVGVYAEKAQPSGADAAAGLELHYAPVVTLARAWLAGQSLDHGTQPECPNNETPTPSRP